MPGPSYPDEFLNELRRVRDLETQRTSVDGQAAAKQELSTLDPTRLYQIAASSMEDGDFGQYGEIEQMLRDGDYPGLKARLGPSLAQKLQGEYLKAWKLAEAQRDPNRTAGEIAQDVPAGLAAGLTNSGWTAGIALAGLHDPKRAAELIESKQKFDEELINPLLSSDLLGQQQLIAAQDAESERVHAADADAEAEIANRGGDNLVGSLAAYGKRVIRDAGSSVKHLATNPTMLMQGTVDAGASMLVSAGTSAVITGVGKAALRQRGARIVAKQMKDLGKEAAEALAEKSLERATKFVEGLGWAGAVAGVEGTSAYQQTFQDVLSKTPTELLQNSPEFPALVAEFKKANPNSSEDEILEMAQVQLAHATALKAAGGTAVTAGLIGHLVGGGGAQPLKVAAEKTFRREVLEETVEEGLQGAYGKMIANEAIRRNVDRSQDAMEGVGGETSTGALLGGFSAGTLKSPSAAASIPRTARELMGKAGSTVASGVSAVTGKRTDAAIAAVEAESQASVKNLSARVSELQSAYAQNKSEVTNTIKGLDESARKPAAAALQTLIDGPFVFDVPASFESLSEQHKAKFQDLKNPKGGDRVKTVERAAKLIVAEKDPAAKEQLVHFLNDLLEPTRQFREASDELTAFSGNQKVAEIVNGFREVLGNIEQLPVVQKALAQSNDVLAKAIEDSANVAIPAPAGTADASTALDPKVQSRVKNIVALATANPVKLAEVAKLEDINAILKMAESNDSMPPNQRKALEGVKVLIENRRLIEDQKLRKIAENGAKARKDGVDFVNDLKQRHLLKQEQSEKDRVSRELTNEETRFHPDKYSAAQDSERVINGMAAGNVGAAKAALEHGVNVLKSQSNKMEAFNKSAAGKGPKGEKGERISYQQLMPNGLEFKDSASNPNSKHPEVWYNALSGDSIALAQAADAETELLYNIFSGLAKAYPELGVKVPEPVRLFDAARKIEDPNQSATETREKIKAAKEARKQREAARTQSTETDNKYARQGRAQALGENGVKKIDPRSASLVAANLRENVNKEAGDAYYAAYQQARDELVKAKLKADEDAKAKLSGAAAKAADHRIMVENGLAPNKEQKAEQKAEQKEQAAFEAQPSEQPSVPQTAPAAPVQAATGTKSTGIAETVKKLEGQGGYELDAIYTDPQGKKRALYIKLKSGKHPLVEISKPLSKDGFAGGIGLSPENAKIAVDKIIGEGAYDDLVEITKKADELQKKITWEDMFGPDRYLDEALAAYNKNLDIMAKYETAESFDESGPIEVASEAQPSEQPEAPQTAPTIEAPSAPVQESSLLARIRSMTDAELEQKMDELDNKLPADQTPEDAAVREALNAEEGRRAEALAAAQQEAEEIEKSKDTARTLTPEEMKAAQTTLKVAQTRHFAGLGRAGQDRAVLTDSLTGLHSVTGQQLTPVNPKKPLLAIYALEGAKPLNDLHGHEALDGALRLMAKVLAKRAADAAKNGGDLEGSVVSEQEAKDTAAEMQQLLGPEFQIVYAVTKHTGTFETTQKNLRDAFRTKIDGLRASGKVSHRKAPPVFYHDASMPKGINWDWDASEGKTSGLNPDSAEVKKWLESVKARSAALAERFTKTTEKSFVKLHPTAVRENRKMSVATKINLIYWNNKSGLLSQAGFELASKLRGDTVFVSMDMRSLRRMDGMFGGANADRILRLFGHTLASVGGDLVNAAHLHGDEFALSGKNPQELEAIVHKFEELLNKIKLHLTKEDGSLIYQEGISFAWGIGKTLKEADSVDLAARKEKDKLDRKRIAEPQRLTDPELIKQKLAEYKGQPNVTQFRPEPPRRSSTGEAGNGVQDDAGRSGTQLQEGGAAAAVAQEVTPAALFPKLFKGAKGKFINWFHQAFNIKKSRDGKPATRLLGKTGSLSIVADVVNKPGKLGEFLGYEPTHELTPAVQKKYSELLVPSDEKTRSQAENWTRSLDRVRDSLGKRPTRKEIADRREALLALHEKEVKQKVPEEKRQGIAPMPVGLQSVAGVTEMLNARLNRFLDRKWGKKTANESKGEKDTRPTIREVFEQDSEVFAEKFNGKSLNLLERVVGPDGKVDYRYNEELATQASMAALQWMITASQRQSVVKDGDELAEDLDLELDGDELDEETRRRLSQGEGLNQAKRSLANTIRRFWGVQGKNTEGMGFTDGIPEALAAELLHALEDVDLMEVDDVQVNDARSTKTVYRFIPAHLGNEHPVYAYPELLEEIVVVDPEKATFYENDKVLVQTSQMSNHNMTTTPESNKARENMQNEKFYLNMPMVEAVIHMTEAEIIRLWGIELPEKLEDRLAQYNVNDLAAIEGKNKTLIGAFRELQKVVQEMKNLAGKKGVDVSKFGKKYQYAVNSVNRIMMLGAHNPQASKLMREMLMSTWSDSLDLSDHNGEHYQYFMLAVAQALGIKIHRNTLEQNVSDAEAKLKELEPVTDALAKWLDEVDAAKAKVIGTKDEPQLPASPLAEIKAKLGDKATPLASMALMEVARMKRAEKAGSNELKSFRTPLYLESDGMTNGPFNSMGLLTTGAFTGTWVINVSRGGLAFGKTPRTANELLKAVNGEDNYTAGMKATENKLDEHLRSLNPTVATLGRQMLDVMSELFDGEVKWDEETGNLVLDRGLGKNPITILVYGSGKPGVANKFTYRLTKAFYAKMSVLMQAGVNDGNIAKTAKALYPDLPADVAEKRLKKLLVGLHAMTTQRVLFDKNSGYSLQNTKNPSPISRIETAGPKSFTFSATELSNLQANFQHLLVEPMYQALQETLGESIFKNGKTMIQATKQHSLLARGMYYRAINEKIAQKITEKAKALEKQGMAPEMAQKKAQAYVNSEFLSHDELNQIWDELADVMPILKADGQSFLLAKSKLLEFWDAKGKEREPFRYSEALDDSYRTKPFVMAPDDAGVGAIPYLTIGMGDGRMVRSIFEEALQNSLQVFDGINIPVGKIAEYGGRINRGAARAFQANIFQEMSKSFDRAMNDPRVKEAFADPEFVREYAVAMKWKTTGISNAELLKRAQKAIRESSRDLDNAALEMQARRMAMNKYGMSWDQMSGTYHPYVSEGLDLPTGVETPEQIAALLEVARLEALKTLQARRAQENLAESKTRKPAPQNLFDKGMKHDTGVQLLYKAEIYDLISKLKGVISQSELEVLAEAYNSGSLDDVRIAAGTPAQISAYQSSEGLSSFAELNAKSAGQTVHGYYSHAEGMVYLMDPSVEALVHELVHASTYQTVAAHYAGKDLGPHKAQIRAAITRLDNLLKIFLNTNFELDPESAAGKALDNARREINSYSTTSASDKAARMNEFMAWVLANRHLAETLGELTLTENFSLMAIDEQVQNLPRTGSAKEDAQAREAVRETLVKNMSSKLARLTRAAWGEIKKLIWGDKKAQEYGSDILSQIRFNTAILTRTAPSVAKTLRDVNMAHSLLALRTANERLEKLQEAFLRLIARNLHESYSPEWAESLTAEKGNMSLLKPRQVALTATARVAKMFPDLSQQERFTFQLMVMAFATEAEINPSSMIKAQELFDQFISKLHWEDLKTGKGDVQNDEAVARERFRFLTGSATGALRDAQGRSSILPIFVALAAVSEEFQTLLAKQQVQNPESKKITGLDSAAERIGIGLMEQMGDRLAGMKQHPANIKHALDQLTDSIAAAALNERDTLAEQIEEQTSSMSRLINDQLVRGLRAAGETALEKGEDLSSSSSRFTQSLGSALKAFAFFTDEKSSIAVAESALEQMDKKPEMKKWVRDFMAELLGRVPSQAKIYDMLKRIRSHVTQVRQAYREKVPLIIESKFKLKPTKDQWNSLHRFMGRYDMASLLEGRSVDEVLDLAADQHKLAGEISRLEQTLTTANSKKAPAWQAKINQYVNFVRTGERGGNLLTNAWAISELLDGSPRKPDLGLSSDAETIAAIDQLITLKLLAQASKEDRAAFSELHGREREGMQFTLSYLRGQRKTEISKATNGFALFNHIKGAIPTETSNGHLIVADNLEHAHLRELGYTYVAPYKGSSIDSLGTSKAYFFAPEGAKTPFNQGITQNVQQTAYGIRRIDGLPLEPNAGVITDPVTMGRLAKLMAREAVGAENLQPIYNIDGNLVALVRTLSPEQLKTLKPAQHLAKAIGSWRGRQVEEEWANTVNDELVESLKEMWQKDVKENPMNQGRYINLLDLEGKDNDPVIRDAVKLFPHEMRESIRRHFGDKKFYVRRSLVDMTIGSRQASVGDMWTGNSRYSKETQEQVRKAAIAFLGINAYRKLVWAERNWQAAMFSVRTNIVIRSLAVPTANFISGIYQLVGRNVSMRAIVTGIPEKIREIEYYTKSMTRKVELEAELFSKADDIQATNKLRAQLQSLLDSQRRLSIWPLIEAGEFSTISDVGQTDRELGLGSNTLIDKLTRAVDELPSGLRDVARQGYLARDTALFKVLQKSVQYSDFVMKSIYYDHLLKHETQLLGESPDFFAKVNEYTHTAGVPVAEAKKRAYQDMARGRVTEEFVNYDLPTGRGRGYLENMGMMWFLNYKLRSTKVALSMMRNNPLHALISTVIPHMGGADTPITGNLFAKLFEGVLGFSVGPRMAFQPIGLNPWYHLIVGGGTWNGDGW